MPKRDILPITTMHSMPPILPMVQINGDWMKSADRKIANLRVLINDKKYGREAIRCVSTVKRSNNNMKNIRNRWNPNSMTLPNALKMLSLYPFCYRFYRFIFRVDSFSEILSNFFISISTLCFVASIQCIYSAYTVQ